VVSDSDGGCVLVVIKCLRFPVPAEGRDLSNEELRAVRAAGYMATNKMFLVPEGPNGGAVVYGATDRYFELFPMEVVSGGVTGEVVCLSGPVPAAGRTLTQYEVLRARKLGVSCSESYFIKPYPGGGAVRWNAGGGFVFKGFIMVERPAGCYCGWCEVTGCTVRRGGSV